MNDLFELADQYAEQSNLDPALFRAVISQESKWNPNAASKKGAGGLGQLMPATAGDPGYGIAPLKDDSPAENLRLSSQYLAKMIQLTGKVDLGLAAYNAGYGAVLKHKGIPPYKETQDYVAKILGNTGKEIAASATPQLGGKLPKYEQGLADYEKIMADPRLQQAVGDITKSDPEAITKLIHKRAIAREKERAANVATAEEAFEDGLVNESLTGRHLRLLDAGARTDWKPDTATKEKELTLGLTNYADLNSYVQGFRNEEDYHRRISEVKLRMEHMSRVSNAVGWDVGKLTLATMGGAMTDPEGFAIAYGIGAGLNSFRVAHSMLAGSRVARVATTALDAAAGNFVVDTGVQRSLQTEQDWARTLQTTLIGSVFGTTVGGVIQARRAGQSAAALSDFSRLSQELGEAVDVNASPRIVQRLQDGIDSARQRMVEIARADGDEAAAYVWRRTGPGASAEDIAGAIREFRKSREAGYSTRDPVHEVSPADIIVRPERMTEGTETLEIAGMRLSQEASAVTTFARNWDETVDPALKAMQERMRAFYDTRKEKLGNYKGLASWLDSPGLVAQNSKSKVARMLGAHLFESATGLGKRTQSAALNYEILHSRLAHEHIPQLKEALLAGLAERGMWEQVRHAFGGGRAGESAFWRQVAMERALHRNAIMAGQEFMSTASESVQKAANILDQFWRQASDHMEKVGIEEGKAIKTLGVVGHMPYRWDVERISDALRNRPEHFDAFRSMIAEEFNNKILNGMMKDLHEQGAAKLQARRTALEGDIAAIQDEIAKNEVARKTVDDTRDVRKDAEAVVRSLNDQEKILRAQQKELEKQLKELQDAPPVTKAEMGRLEVQYLTTGKVLGKEMATVAAEPGAKQVTSSQLVQMIKEVPGLLKSERRELDAFVAALERDLAEGDDFPVFLVPNKEGTSFYAQGEHFIRLNQFDPEKGLSPALAFTALHELAHARTARWFGKIRYEVLRPLGYDLSKAWQAPYMIDLNAAAKVGIPPEVAMAWNKVENVRGLLMKEYPQLVGQTHGIGYAMRDSFELVAQIFNSVSVRTALDAIKIDGDRSLLRTVWEAIANLFNKGERTGLTDVVEGLDMVSRQHGKWQQRNGEVNFAEARSRADVESALAAIKEQRAKIKEQVTEARSVRNGAKEAAKKVNATSGAKDLKALRLQLENRKAQLADMQRDPLGWWSNEVNKLRSEAEAKADATTSSYLKQIIQDPESRTNGITLHASRLAEDLLNENWHGGRVDAELAKDFGTMLRERLADRSRTEFDLARTKNVGGQDIALMDFMELDGLSQVKSGSHRVAGQVALARMGMKDPVSIAAAMEAARIDGASPDELKALQHGFDFLSDNLRSSDHSAMHALRNMTYFTRMGKLGLSMVADVPSMASTLGFSLAMKTWGKSWLQHSINGKNAYGVGGATAFAKQLAEVAPGALGRDHRLMSMVPDNPATGASDRAGASLLQRTSARGAQFVSWISGANSVTMAMHRALLPVLAEELIGAVRGKSAIKDVRLRDMGMSAELIQRIKAQMDEFDAGRRKGDAVNWNQWTDQLAADELIAVIHRGMYQTLQKSLLGEQPIWLTDSAMGRLIGQFRRFGLTASEKITARNAVGYKDSQALVAAVMGLTWAGLLYYARVHINAAGKDDPDQYIEDQLSPLALTRGVLSLWNASGLGADLANIGETLFGGTHKVEASPAAALGVVKDIAKAGAAVGSLAGEGEGKDAAAAVMRLMPGGNSVPIMYLMNQLQND